MSYKRRLCREELRAAFRCSSLRIAPIPEVSLSAWRKCTTSWAVMAEIHVGTSAFTANGWEGSFYPMPISRRRFGAAQSRNQDDWRSLFINAARRERSSSITAVNLSASP
jgi:hypothetical protein